MLAKKSGLSPEFSLYLDAIRFLAAVLVVIAHLLKLGLISGPATVFVPDLGREAVIVFFVLSGFVIKYSVDQKHHNFREYVLARCARIYSVALPALVISFVLVALVLRFSDVDVKTSYQVAKAYVYFPFHMLFAGEFWNLAETPPWLIPYWSLSYEVWYYALFGAAYYFSGRRRLLVVTGILALVGFKLWLLLPIWLSGSWLNDWCKSNAIPVKWAKAGWILSIAGLFALKLINLDDHLRLLGNAIWPFPGLILGSADRYLADYVVCVLVLVNFACARALAFPALCKIRGMVRALSSYTFTLYLMHELVLMTWTSFYPHNARSVTDVALLALTVACVTYLVGFLTERRKNTYERFFRRLYYRVFRMWAAGSSRIQR